MSGTAGNLPGIGPMNPHSEGCEERITVLELHSLVDSCGCQAIWKMLQERNSFLKNFTKGSTWVSPSVI